jgi:hypothetical protein
MLEGTIMKAFPVIRVRRPFRDGDEIMLHFAMIGCSTAEEAVMAYKPELGDKVEFAWWDAPRPPERPLVIGP